MQKQNRGAKNCRNGGGPGPAKKSFEYSTILITGLPAADDRTGREKRQDRKSCLPRGRSHRPAGEGEGGGPTFPLLRHGCKSHRAAVETQSVGRSPFSPLANAAFLDSPKLASIAQRLPSIWGKNHFGPSFPSRSSPGKGEKVFCL